MARAAHSDFVLYRRLLRQVRPCWFHIGGIFLLGLLSSPLALLTPLPLKIAVDSVVGSHPLPAFLDVLLPPAARSGSTILVLAVTLVVAIGLVEQVQGLVSSLLRRYTSEKLVLGFQAQLFRHVQRLSLAYHDSKGTSDSAYRIQNDAPSIQYIVVDGVIPLVTASVTLAGMIYVTGRIDWQLVLVALAISPVVVLASRAYRWRLRNQAIEVKRLESSALSVIQETLAALRVVRAFGQEDSEQARFAHRSSEGMRARLRFAFVESGFGLLIGVTTAIGTAAVLFIGVRHVKAGVLTLGDLVLVMAYLAQLYDPLTTIGRKAASLQSHLASAERAFALLDSVPDVPERPNARPLSRAVGAVAFRNVSFAYDGGPHALHDVSFEIGPGNHLGIVGTTGAGKTTLVSLLTRFYDPTAGQLLLDGIDLRDYRLGDLRNQFAIVLQESVLFSVSIAANIAYARPGASLGDIRAAAQAANAHQFIVELPQGYDTLVGERGLRLSGGERQRIALARAFLKDAPILILDEPTSAVDIETEDMIMTAMERLMHGRTTFVISHRPSMLRTCTLLLRLDNGRLVAMTSEVSSTGA